MGRVADEFRSAWGYDFGGSGFSAMKWMNDLDTIFKNLHIIVNNAAETIGGGPNEDNNRRAPFAPPFEGK